MATSQNTPFKVSLHAYIHRLSSSRDFKQGYEDYFKGVTPNYINILYERGRVFALFTKLHNVPRSRWVKGKLSKAGQERLLSAIKTKYII